MVVADMLGKAQEAIMGAHDDKASDLERNVRDDTQKAPLTSDFGVRQSNNDDWLKVVSDDKIGPALLEDPFGREKVLSFPAKSSFTLLTLSDPPVRP